MNSFKFIAAAVSLICCLAMSAAVQRDDSPKNEMEQGWEALWTGNLSEALRISRLVLKGDRSKPEALRLFGLVLLHYGEPENAVKPLRNVALQRGECGDYRLLAVACDMAGMHEEANRVRLSAESSGNIKAPDLYALAWQKPGVDGRISLLKRIVEQFPSSCKGVPEEIAYWEQRRGRTLRRMDGRIPENGVTLKLRTLFNREWVVSREGSGEEIWLMVDTACRTTVLPRETAKKIGLSWIQASHPVAGAYPQEPAPEYGLLEKLDMGGLRFSDVPVIVVGDVVSNLKRRSGKLRHVYRHVADKTTARVVYKGILGMDLLRGMKIRFDRQENELRLFPEGADDATLLDGDPSTWTPIPAFSIHDQVFMHSSLGLQPRVLALVSSASEVDFASEVSLAGTGIVPNSKYRVDLNYIMGWFNECLPLAGEVKTVPETTDIGVGRSLNKAFMLPVYPEPIGSDVRAGLCIGKSLSDLFAVALDLDGGKIYLRQVHFEKGEAGRE